jgi:hypothetical protein
MTSLLWMAAVLMLAGAVFLVADVGGAGLWIAIIAVGIGIVALDRTRQPR